MGVIGAPHLHPSHHGDHRSPAPAPGSPQGSSEPRLCIPVPLGVTRALPLHPGPQGGNRSPAAVPGYFWGITRALPLHLHLPGCEQSRGHNGPGPVPVHILIHMVLAKAQGLGDALTRAHPSPQAAGSCSPAALPPPANWQSRQVPGAGSRWSRRLSARPRLA